ncbi:MAG: acyl-CoA dehydrogenase family protein [Actinomycetota bacterium]
MDLRFSAEDEAYRDRLRSWLTANRDHARFPRDPMKAVATARDWQRRLYEAGYVGLSWPRAFGGQEATLTQQVVAAQEFARASVPPLINLVGLDILGPTLIRHGSDEQRRRFLPGILTAETIWCQGFSEPDAGSDLASLRTRAELAGDRFVVNGQKVWTSLGPVADWCFLLARTDPKAPKRQGISYLLCDMRSAGVTVRPLRNAAGGIHFSEVFFEDVEIPRDQLVGELHHGWPIARTTLDHERSGLGGVLALEQHLNRLVAMATTGDGAPARLGQEDRRRLARHWVEVEALRHHGYRTLSAQLAGRDPGGEAAAGKLYASEARQRIMRTALAVQGPLAAVPKRSPHAVDGGRWQPLYFDALAYTIGGGTSEIMRNVLAERVLGLPRSVED